MIANYQCWSVLIRVNQRSIVFLVIKICEASCDSWFKKYVVFKEINIMGNSSQKSDERKVALITGSAKNIGRAIALSLSKEQINVVVHYNRSRESAEEVLSEIKRNDVDGLVVQADVTKYEDVERMFKEIYSYFGRLDILVNNVGNFLYKDTLNISVNEWNEIINSNLNSTFYCCKLAVESMIKNKYGRIINIGASSCDKVKAYQYVVPYYVAKTGILILTQSLAVPLAKYNITVNMISPGIVKDNEVTNEDDVKHMPSGRFAKFEDIVNAVKFLISDKSDYITGTNIGVSGGWNI
jgi:NAD(P)-dependent dehydrogenase (short-subunit alcohol dehydrogenase family)